MFLVSAIIGSERILTASFCRYAATRRLTGFIGVMEQVGAPDSQGVIKFKSVSSLFDARYGQGGGADDRRTRGSTIGTMTRAHYADRTSLSLAIRRAS
jgi:hypothetical protein